MSQDKPLRQSFSARPLRRGLAIMVIALPLFFAFFDYRILNPENIGWVFQSDWGQHALGFHSFRQHIPAQGPASTRLLDWPTGTTLGMLDGNPFISLPLSLLSNFLPSDFQFIGIWILLCILAHVTFSYALSASKSAGFIETIAATFLLCLSPTLFQREFHDTLMAHWLILWAILVYLSNRDRLTKDAIWLILLSITAFIHVYLLLMVGVVWASDLARFVWRHRDQGAGKHIALAARASLTACIVFLCLRAAGFLVSGYGWGAGGFGQYAMRLDGLFNPTLPGVSLFLPVTAPPNIHLNISPFEGFQYLGAGNLLLLVTMLFCWIRGRMKLHQEDMRKFLWLIPGMLALTLLAITNDIHLFGRHFEIPLPRQMMRVTSILRASGRLFWPVNYIIILFSIWMAYTLPKRQAAMLLVFCALLQAVDISPLAATLRPNTAFRPVAFPRTPDPRWNTLISSAHVVELEPFVMDGTNSFAY